MNCQRAMLLIGADPYATSAELEEHLRHCPACSEFRAQMVGLEGNIRRALEQPPLETAPATAIVATLPVRQRARPSAWRGWALAASLLICAMGTMAVWLLRPTDSLAHEIAVHVSGEPLSWDSKTAVGADYLQRVLRNAGVASKVTSAEVMYAQTCLFRGHYVPHLVVQTANGPVTVMILQNEHVSGRRSFYEGGFAGVIVPAAQGSIAVLARDSAAIDNVAAEMRRTLQSQAPAASGDGR